MITGISAPLIIMAAFCTFTAAAYLAMLPLAYRVLLRVQEAPVHTRPDPEIWRHIRALRLFEAACLLADVEPDERIVNEAGDANGWYRALIDAIRSGEVKRTPTRFDGDHTFMDGYSPYELTVVDRAELQTFANKRNTHRAFLRDN